MSLVLLVACGTREVLESRQGTVPIGVDLSGNWQIQTDERSDRQRIRQAIRRTDGINDRDLVRRPDRDSTDRNRQSGRSGVKGGLVFVFLETGSFLKVTQTEHGLFISFDRAVVEEYRFGEDRIINVGEVEAQRVTGWEGRQLVVETLDKNRMKMTERLSLIESDDVLERTITFRSSDGEVETVVQRFDRRG
ncbi:MAG: hypothetical protein P8M18_05830 [Woeseiaceae bacterium]|nr:hypothetical protein [Woeseiaceae bacterium]